MILRTLCQLVIQKSKILLTILIDYKTVFDSVDHKFIDITLEDAKVNNKVRAM